MIFVDGLPFPTDSSHEGGALVTLLEHPKLVSASNTFEAMEEVKFSASKEYALQGRWVYVFQREFATVDPAHIDFIGTDEATTCVGLVIRNQRNGMTSVAHMDSTIVVDIGLTQMLSLVFDKNFDDDLDVHLIGGFEDVLPKVKTSTGSVIPASFDRTTRCPDEIVRRIRISASNEDPTWNGKLLETYDTQNDRFVIAPCSWTFWQVHVALTLQDLSDEEILLQCSTSPSAEGPEFVDNLRRQWDYLIKQPLWNMTFPTRHPRVFEWTADGSWKRCLFSPQDSWNEDGAQTSFQMT